MVVQEDCGSILEKQYMILLSFFYYLSILVLISGVICMYNTVHMFFESFTYMYCT